MESSEVQSRDLEIHLPVIPTRRRRKWIAAVSSCRGTEPFIAHGNHMVRVERLDVLRSR
jgi:hypothetical protein